MFTHLSEEEKEEQGNFTNFLSFSCRWALNLLGFNPPSFLSRLYLLGNTQKCQRSWTILCVKDLKAKTVHISEWRPRS